MSNGLALLNNNQQSSPTSTRDGSIDFLRIDTLAVCGVSYRGVRTHRIVSVSPVSECSATMTPANGNTLLENTPSGHAAQVSPHSILIITRLGGHVFSPVSEHLVDNGFDRLRFFIRIELEISSGFNSNASVQMIFFVVNFE